MSNSYEMMMLLEAHIANDTQAQSLTKENAKMTNVTIVELSIAQLNDIAVELDNIYVSYILIDNGDNTTTIKGTLKDDGSTYTEHYDHAVHIKNLYNVESNMNDLTLNYLWSILLEDQLMVVDYVECVQHRQAILNLIDEHEYAIEELWNLELMEDHACGGLAYESTAPWAEADGIDAQIKVWEYKFKKEHADMEVLKKMYFMQDMGEEVNAVVPF